MITKHYIAYRKNNNFIELHINKDWIKLYMFPNAKYDDPENKIEYLENKTWVLTARLYIKPGDDIDYAMRLIDTSYNVL